MGKGCRGGLSEEHYTWEEVKRHAKPEDKWIVIDDTVYNVTEFVKRHPGGSRIIGHYAGQDASEAFRSFHLDTQLVSKYMTGLQIGKLQCSQMKRDDEIKKDFLDLVQTAEKLKLFKPSIVFFLLHFLHLIIFEALAFWILYHFGTGWIPYLTSMMLYAIALSQAGWSQHDFGHLSVFPSSWLNRVFHSISMNIIKGASTSWWQHLHNQHHAKPNVINKDPDVRLEPMFVLGDEIPKRVAEKRISRIPYNWQQYYFFAIGPPLLFPVYFQYMVFKHPITRGNWLDVFLMTLFYVKYLVLYVPQLGLMSALIFFFLTRCLESHWFVWVSQSNHIPMDIEDDKERPWLALQLYATCNIEKGYFNDWFTGHLNFQIEHHLFPTMPRHNLYKIQPHVRALCAKHGIPYKLKSLPQAFGDVVRSLKRSGEIWEVHYKRLRSL